MLFDSVTATSTPTSTSTGRSTDDASKLEGDLNRFLTLLVTQLQNQDPLQPLDANEFTSQLVQFASVEQQIYQNSNLEKLLSAQQSGQSAATVGYLGTDVQAEGKTLPLQDGMARGFYSLPENATETTLTIKDAAGKTVQTIKGETTAGMHEFLWNGETSDGRPLADGAYSFTVSAKNKAGQELECAQGYFGRVTGVSNATGSTVLELGDVSLELDDVAAVREPATRSSSTPAETE
jgi:flagellar basal-body rod modification protein FlgD